MFHQTTFYRDSRDFQFVKSLSVC